MSSSYIVHRDGVACEFEGIRYRYSFAHRGCTGNVDYTGHAEDVTRKALKAALRPGDVFYDIGAHGGVYTLSLSRAHPLIEVHSFEPLPEELLENLKLNGHSATRVHRVAVGDKPGQVMMTTKYRSSNHIGTKDEPGDRFVHVVRLDDFMLEHSLPPPSWIKIDIEGMELPALQGAERLLRKSRPVVICEINHLVTRFGSDLHALTSFMKGCGYGFYRLEASKLHPLPMPCSNLGDIESADSNYWFVPEGRSIENMNH